MYIAEDGAFYMANTGDKELRV